MIFVFVKTILRPFDEIFSRHHFNDWVIYRSFGPLWSRLRRRSGTGRKLVAAAGIEPAPTSASLAYTFSLHQWATDTKRVSRVKTRRSTLELRYITNKKARRHKPAGSNYRHKKTRRDFSGRVFPRWENDGRFCPVRQ